VNLLTNTREVDGMTRTARYIHISQHALQTPLYPMVTPAGEAVWMWNLTHPAAIEAAADYAWDNYGGEPGSIYVYAAYPDVPPRIDPEYDGTYNGASVMTDAPVEIVPILTVEAESHAQLLQALILMCGR